MQKMRCIYCKQDSSESLSVQHIIPESLGNIEHILPRGVVCDRCNNYVAREVEHPFIDSDFIRDRRFSLSVPNKRGRFPIIPAVHLQSMTRVGFMREKQGNQVLVGPPDEKDSHRWVRALMRRERGTLIAPAGLEPPRGDVAARFTAKVGIEALSKLALGAEGGLDEIVDHPQLDVARHLVRRGNQGAPWPVSCRRIYHRDCRFEENGERFQILHEYDLLFTDPGEVYAVVAVFGVEYCVNLGGPELDGYEAWLEEHDFQSPLYCGRNG